jgi:hypothetical protein
MNFIKYKNYIENIFNIDDNAYDNAFNILNCNNKNVNDKKVNDKKVNNKKVTINKVCNVILIPDRNEIDNACIKYDIWYSMYELKLIRDSYLYELNVISRVNGINMSDALTIWKENN